MAVWRGARTIQVFHGTQREKQKQWNKFSHCLANTGIGGEQVLLILLFICFVNVVKSPEMEHLTEGRGPRSRCLQVRQEEGEEFTRPAGKHACRSALGVRVFTAVSADFRSVGCWSVCCNKQQGSCISWTIVILTVLPGWLHAWEMCAMHEFVDRDLSL